MQTNPIKAALAAGRVQIGTWINLVRNPAVRRPSGGYGPGRKIIAYSSDVAVLRSGYAAAVGRLRPGG